MNVDWNWIKQRPHFLAESLSRENDVMILYPYAWRRSRLVKNSKNSLKIAPFFLLPFGGRIGGIRKINNFLLRLAARIYLYFSDFDYIWISSPWLFQCLPKKINKPIVYDLMDDVLEFDMPKSARDILTISEAELIERSAIIFCSSGNLQNNKILKFGASEKYTIINNAYSSFDGRVSGKVIVSKFKRIGYIGTLSSWFDSNAILEIIQNFDDVEIHLVGPYDDLIYEKINHERVIFHGPINYQDLPGVINCCDAMIMPFITSELIKSVDPVKIYEYIYFGKPIISIWYPELDKFHKYVNFYRSNTELIEVFKSMVNLDFKKKYTDQERDQFIMKNTWERRAYYIQKVLDEFTI